MNQIRKINFKLISNYDVDKFVALFESRCSNKGIQSVEATLASYEIVIIYVNPTQLYEKDLDKLITDIKACRPVERRPVAKSIVVYIENIENLNATYKEKFFRNFKKWAAIDEGIVDYDSKDKDDGTLIEVLDKLLGQYLEKGPFEAVIDRT